MTEEMIEQAINVIGDGRANGKFKYIQGVGVQCGEEQHLIEIKKVRFEWLRQIFRKLGGMK